MNRALMLLSCLILLVSSFAYAESQYAENRIVRIDIQEKCIEITTRENVGTNYYHASWGISGDSRNILYGELIWANDVDFVWFDSEFKFRITDTDAMAEVSQWKIGQELRFHIDAYSFPKGLNFGNDLYNLELKRNAPAALLGGKVTIGEFESIYVHHCPEYPDGTWTPPK